MGSGSWRDVSTVFEAPFSIYPSVRQKQICPKIDDEFLSALKTRSNRGPGTLPPEISLGRIHTFPNRSFAWGAATMPPC